MLHLAAFKFRHILAEDGGPVQTLEVAEMPGFERRQFQANATLRDDLMQRRRRLAIYGNVDATGTDASPMVARFKAISEALERWAYHDCMCGDRRRYGFDLDASSNGMAAFPGLTAKPARLRARYEAIERASLFDWWEGRCAGELVPTRWPGTTAVRIANPLGEGVTAIAFRAYGESCFAYGHAAGPSFEHACARAVVEMHRSSMVLCHHRLAVIAGRAEPPSDRFERRCLFFSTAEGHELFLRRIADRATAAPRPWRIACDREVEGPWSRYARVWRVVIPAPSTAFLDADERYFFW